MRTTFERIADALETIAQLLKQSASLKPPLRPLPDDRLPFERFKGEEPATSTNGQNSVEN